MNKIDLIVGFCVLIIFASIGVYQYYLVSDRPKYTTEYTKEYNFDTVIEMLL